MYTPGMFKGKKITVMGLGLLGRGVGDVKFLAEEGAKLIVTDLKSKEELASSLEALSPEKIGDAASRIQFVFGEHRLEDFRNRDFILKAAGVPLYSPYIEEARRNDIPIEMSTALFAALAPVMVIGATGTRGKSTVTYALHAVIEEAVKQKIFPDCKNVFLGGNIRGVSTLALLREAQAGDIAVLELDSWQLQGFSERALSPHLAIFTSFFPDHLNYYHNNVNTYLGDKAAIFKYQKPQDILILGKQAQEIVEQCYGKEIMSQKIIAKTSDMPLQWKLLLPGEHNRYNLALVYRAAQVLTIPDEVTRKVLETFKSIPGRLEHVRTYNGIDIFNDTNSTTPEATGAGLHSMKFSGRIILIFGGADKNLDMRKVLAEISTLVYAVILLPGTGTERIEKDLRTLCAETHCIIEKADSLKHAVEKSLHHAHSGDTILFSPAFASFGMFKNEYDRGEQFVELIKHL